MKDQFNFQFRGNDYTVHVLYYAPAQRATYVDPGYDAEIDFEVYRGAHKVNAKWDEDAILRMYEEYLDDQYWESRISEHELYMENF